eukprot:scaffold168799_cov19-Tisochrysis_lutea.AAC.1
MPHSYAPGDDIEKPRRSPAVVAALSGRTMLRQVGVEGTKRAVCVFVCVLRDAGSAERAHDAAAGGSDRGKEEGRRCLAAGHWGRWKQWSQGGVCCAEWAHHAAEGVENTKGACLGTNLIGSLAPHNAVTPGCSQCREEQCSLLASLAHCASIPITMNTPIPAGQFTGPPLPALHPFHEQPQQPCRGTRGRWTGFRLTPAQGHKMSCER